MYSIPCVGKFFIQGFDPFFHKVIVFEEFNMLFYKSSFLKRLLEGRSYSYPIKCGPDSTFFFKGPIIFVSNDDVRDNCYDYVLLGRLKFVNANCKYWQGEVEAESVSCKEEASGVGDETSLSLVEVLSGGTDEDFYM